MKKTTKLLLLLVVITTCMAFDVSTLLLKPLYSPLAKQQTRMSQDEKDQHIKDYYEKYKDLGMWIDEVRERKLENLAYYYKINLNAYDKFKEFEVDLKELSANGFFSYYLLDYSLISEIIVEGTIVDSLGMNQQDDIYHTVQILKVEEWLKGKELFAKEPKYLKLYYEKGMVYHWNGSGKLGHDNLGGLLDYPIYNKGRKIVLCADKKPSNKYFYSYGFREKRNRIPKNEMIYPSDIDADTVFINPIGFDSVEVTMKNNILKMVEINDSKNFYNIKFK